METKRVDYKIVFQKIAERKKLFLKTLPIAFVVSCLWILPQPRYYTCDVMLAPESTEESATGSLSSLASSFGFNIGGVANDAIYPMLYPDLFTSPEFLVNVLGIHINSVDEDGEIIDADYYTYLTKMQKNNWLLQPFKDLFRTIKRWVKPPKPEDMRAEDVTRLNPFYLSTDDYELVTNMSDIITCTVDKKTNVITINVMDQNRRVCALIADSVRVRLQNFITEYRTAKARKDYAYYKNLTDSVKSEYDEAVDLYSQYCETHKDMILQRYISERDKLENDMALKYETYTTMMAQLTAAKAKVQEKTPAFTTLKSASAPVKPAGPKRMIFVAVMLVLTCIGTSVYILRDIIKESI